MLFFYLSAGCKGHTPEYQREKERKSTTLMMERGELKWKLLLHLCIINLNKHYIKLEFKRLNSNLVAFLKIRFIVKSLYFKVYNTLPVYHHSYIYFINLKPIYNPFIHSSTLFPLRTFSFFFKKSTCFHFAACLSTFTFFSPFFLIAKDETKMENALSRKMSGECF